jgi:alanine racemase
VSRPTSLYIDQDALLHNIKAVKRYAPNKKIIAMVKSNAYGCGVRVVVPALESSVDGFGVACIEEAMVVRELSSDCECVLFQGVFEVSELLKAYDHNLQLVIHQKSQLDWLLKNPAPNQVKVWVKVNTGMHRLGFMSDFVAEVMDALTACPWVDKDISLMTHFACADDLKNPNNYAQIEKFSVLSASYANMPKSISNSAGIMSLPEAHADIVRAGIMLYGISPFGGKIGFDLGLKPVMRFVSAVTTIHHYPAGSAVGYGATWQSDKPSIIGVVPVGYGDGYPRHIKNNTKTWVKGYEAPIVGRISMDMLTIDLTNCKNVKIGDQVELWGSHIPVETVAKSAGTIAYELLCQVSNRVIRKLEVS